MKRKKRIQRNRKLKITKISDLNFGWMNSIKNQDFGKAMCAVRTDAPVTLHCVMCSMHVTELHTQGCQWHCTTRILQSENDGLLSLLQCFIMQLIYGSRVSRSYPCTWSDIKCHLGSNGAEEKLPKYINISLPERGNL